MVGRSLEVGPRAVELQHDRGIRDIRACPDRLRSGSDAVDGVEPTDRAVETAGALDLSRIDVSRVDRRETVCGHLLDAHRAAPMVIPRARSRGADR